MGYFWVITGVELKKKNVFSNERKNKKSHTSQGWKIHWIISLNCQDFIFQNKNLRFNSICLKTVQNLFEAFKKFVGNYNWPYQRNNELVRLRLKKLYQEEAFGINADKVKSEHSPIMWQKISIYLPVHV